MLPALPRRLGEIQFVDASIGAFVSELKENGLYDSTMIVITAKHGQSHIDPSRYVSQLIKAPHLSLCSPMRATFHSRNLPTTPLALDRRKMTSR
jgi:arylsulfatase A-like enzyme